MREIKFRAWHKIEKVMLNVTVLSFMNYADGRRLEQCEGYYGDNRRLRFDRRDVEWLQYTGLQDKNGVEIYEGDIVRKDGWSEPKEWRWVVEWSGKDSRFKPGRDFLVDCEVIGNIYENPELLTTQ